MQETIDKTNTSTPAAPRTDRLELVKELGRGSIGIVHKARNPQQGRVIALRQFMVPEWLDDANEVLKRILAEARAASALDHPNVARLYTCGYKGFTVFVTSEFVEGQSLKEVMAARTPELAEILALAKQLCSALDYAHDKGVFHHFLNPSNIKVLPDGTLKLLDFGLLRDKNLLSQTPAKKLENEPYLSPEQVRNKPLDSAANLFSAATMLYELYTARNPFSGQHLGEVDRAITDVNPHPLNMAHPRVPPAISAVILKALSKSPEERYKSGQQLFAALEDAMKAEPARAAAAPKAPTGEAPKLNLPDMAHKAVAAPARALPTVAAVAPASARVQVGTVNQWKLVGAVATCLFVVGALAYVFRRPPAETAVETPQAQPVVASTPAPAPAPVASEPADAASEPTPAAETPIAPAPVWARRGKNARAPRVAAAPAAAAPAQGQLYVSSVPADATVEIEGVAGQSWKAGQTISPLAAGTYKVTVSKPGYAPDIRSIQVSASNRATVEVRLTAVKAFLTVIGSPAGASVLVDGKETGRITPVTFLLDPARHSVVLRKSGYLDAGSDVQLAAGQTVSYSPTLMVAGRTDNIKIMGGGIGKIFGGGGSPQGKARIEIKSDPKGAQVVINGTALQKTTPVEIQVEAGNYDITIQKDGYKAVHENAIVGIEDRVKIDKALSR